MKHHAPGRGPRRSHPGTHWACTAEPGLPPGHGRSGRHPPGLTAPGGPLTEHAGGRPASLGWGPRGPVGARLGCAASCRLPRSRVRLRSLQRQVSGVTPGRTELVLCFQRPARVGPSHRRRGRVGYSDLAQFPAAAPELVSLPRLSNECFLRGACCVPCGDDPAARRAVGVHLPSKRDGPGPWAACGPSPAPCLPFLLGFRHSVTPGV